MGFIAQADDVSAVAQEAFSFGEFLNRGHVQAAAQVGFQFCSQVISAVEYADIGVVQVCLGICEQTAALVFKVAAVHYDDDRRIVHAGHIAAHQLAGKEKHRVRLSAACSAEIGAALAITTSRVKSLEDTLTEHPGSEELRIPANDFDFVLCYTFISEIDIIPKNFQDAFRCQCAFYKRAHLIDSDTPIGVAVFYFLPGVEVFLRCELRAQPGIGTIADDGKSRVFHH